MLPFVGGCCSVLAMNNTPKYPDIVVDLIGEDGNAFAIMGRVTRAMRNAGLPTEEVEQFRTEAMSGDYDNLLRTVMLWVAFDTPSYEDYEDDDECEPCWNWACDDDDCHGECCE